MQIQSVLNPISVATDVISNIRKHFEVSLLAEQKASGTIPIVRYSEYTRNHALAVLGHQAFKASNVLEQLKMIKIPDIQNLNEKVGAVNFEWELNKNLFFDAVGRFYSKRVLTCIFKSGKWHFPGTDMQSRQKQLHFSAVVTTTLLEAIAPRADPAQGTV